MVDMSKPSNPKVRIPSHQRQAVENRFLLERMRADAEEYAKIGKSFIENHVDHTRLAEFNSLIARLEKLGCRRDVLFRCLYRLYNSTKKKVEIPHPPHIDSLISSTLDLIGKIKRFEQTNVMQTLRGIASEDMAAEAGVKTGPGWTMVMPFAHYRRFYGTFVDDLLGKLKAYTIHTGRLTKMWWRPRTDLVKSCARETCSLYPKILTDEYRDDLIAQLLDAFDNKDAKNSVRSLQLKRDTFLKNHSSLYWLLEKQLRDEHEAAKGGESPKKT